MYKCNVSYSSKRSRSRGSFTASASAGMLKHLGQNGKTRHGVNIHNACRLQIHEYLSAPRKICARAHRGLGKNNKYRHTC